MTEIDIEKVPSIVRRWLEQGYPDDRPTGADVEHSAFLRRLLEGKEIFKDPPPRAFSYPWYNLLEDGEADGYMDVWEHGKYIMICQAPWKLIEANDDGSMIVEWEPSGLRCELIGNKDENHYESSKMVVLQDD